MPKVCHCRRINEQKAFYTIKVNDWIAADAKIGHWPKSCQIKGFVKDLVFLKKIFVLGFHLMLKRNNNNRASFRFNAGAVAVANNGRNWRYILVCN